MRIACALALFVAGCAHARPLFFDHSAQGWSPYRAHVARLDGDRYADVVWHQESEPSRTYVGLGTGDGGFVLPPPVDHPRAAVEAHVADVDGDGLDDLIRARAADGALDLDVARATGDGGWHAPFAAVLPHASLADWASAAGDVTGDGRADLVVRWRDASGVGRLTAWVSSLGGAAWIAGPTLALDDAALASVAGERALGVLLGDVTGDGRADAVIVDAIDAWRIRVASADGRGGGASQRALVLARDNWIDAPPELVVRAATPPALLLADLDGDGASDLVLVEHRGAATRIRTVRADRTGGLGPDVREHELGVLATHWAAGDFDGDGRDDLLACALGEHNVAQVLRSDGAGWREGPVSVHPAQGWAGYRPLVLDVDGDGRADVAWNELGALNRTYVAFGTASGALDLRR